MTNPSGDALRANEIAAWNAAIEAAAKLASKKGLIGMKELAEDIRKLKK